MKMSIQPLIIFSIVVVISLTATHRLAGADSEVSGIFKGNDQPAKLMFVSAQKGTAFAGTDTIKLIFTEKDPSKDERPDLKALFGGYGSARLMGIRPDGRVVACDIVHEGLTQKPISWPSSVKL